MPKQMLSGKAARAALLAGVNAVADPVKTTLGPRGRNVLLDRPGQPLATRDGVTVAKETSWLPDPFENIGAAYVREVADAAVVEAGDGTTTATVILQAIVTEGIKLIDAGAEPLLLADGIAIATEACVEAIKRLSIEATPELVEQVAIISTHGDKELGKLIAETAVKLGANGAIELAESRDHKTTVEHLEGFYFERGWRGPNGVNAIFVNDPSGQRCVLKNPYILLSERMIIGCTQKLNGDHLFNILQACVMARRPLLIIAEDLTGDALNVFTANIAAGTLPGGCFVKLPGFGENRAAALEDLRIAVGAKRVHTQNSTRQDDVLSSFTLDDLGTCAQAIISPARTVLLEGNANTMLLPKRIKQLITESQESTNPFEKQQLDHRIARLTGGVAVLRVGAESEPAMIEKKARAEDAVHACRGAMQEGVVPGGGMALARASGSRTWNNEKGWTVPGDGDGYDLLMKAITAPAKQIMRNAGLDPESPLKLIAAGLSDTQGSIGFNAATGKCGDMYAMGIVDPTKVVLTALRKAASIAALLLTSEVIVCDIPEKQLNPMPPHLRM